MLLFLIKSGACMMMFLIFYKLFLEKENMHVFKRFYLIFAVLFSLIIPNIVLTEYTHVLISSMENNPLGDKGDVFVAESLPTNIDLVNWPLLLWSLYGIGCVVFGFRFIANFYQILNRLRKNPKLRENSTTKVLLSEQLPPHTFFKYIFLNKLSYESKSVPKEVLLHEEIHAKQLHSIDVLLIEILKVVLWFNPLVYVFGNFMKLNHEFLADSAVLKKNVPTWNYQNTLLSYVSNGSFNKHQSIKMANAINYSSIKKRFVIMKKNTSKSSVFLRSTLVLPLLVLLFYGFSEKKTVALPNANEEIILGNQPDSEKPSKSFEVKGQTNGVSNQNSQQSASREQMAEYNKLAKKYNDMPRNNMRIKTKEVDRLKYIYNVMSDKQREDAEPFPEFPEPPSPPEAPKATNHIEAAEQQLEMEEKEIERKRKEIEMKLKEAESVKMEAALKEQERALEEQEKALKEQELAMKEQEAAMRAHENAMEEQEIAIKEKEKVMKPPKPPLPPAPKSPLKHAIEMAEQGAVFFYKDKKVTSDEAIKILKREKDLSMSIERTNDETPIVKIDTHF